MKIHTTKTDQPPKTLSEVCGKQPGAFQEIIDRKSEALKKMEQETGKRIRYARAAQWSMSEAA